VYGGRKSLKDLLTPIWDIRKIKGPRQVTLKTRQTSLLGLRKIH